MLLVVAAALVGLHYVKNLLNQFTDTKPMALPALQMSQPEIEQVRARFDAFKKALNEGQSVGPLELTGNDINALIDSGKDLQSLRGRVFVSVEGDQLKGQVSFPLKETGLPLVKNRYLNGSAAFNVSFTNEVLHVAVVSITVKGKPLPELYMEKLRSENFAQGFSKDPQTMKSLEHLKSIEIKDGHLVVVPKPKSN